LRLPLFFALNRNFVMHQLPLFFRSASVFVFCLGALMGCAKTPESPVSGASEAAAASGALEAKASQGINSSNENAKFTTLAKNESVPTFSVADFSGQMVHVGPEQPVTLLNFWATWCAPCIEEFPDLEKIHLALAPKGLRVLGLNVDELNMDALTAFGRQNGATFTLLADPFGDLQDRYKSIAMPSTFLIRADGTLEHLWTGRLPDDAMSTIESYLTSLNS